MADVAYHGRRGGNTAVIGAWIDRIAVQLAGMQPVEPPRDGRHIELDEDVGDLEGEVEVFLRAAASTPRAPDVLEVIAGLPYRFTKDGTCVFRRRFGQRSRGALTRWSVVRCGQRAFLRMRLAWSVLLGGTLLPVAVLILSAGRMRWTEVVQVRNALPFVVLIAIVLGVILVLVMREWAEAVEYVDELRQVGAEQAVDHQDTRTES